MVDSSPNRKTVFGRRRLAGGVGALVLAGLTPSVAAAKKKKKPKRIKLSAAFGAPMALPSQAGSVFGPTDLSINSGITGAKIVAVEVILNGYTMPAPDAVDIVLVFEDESFVVMSDAGVNGAVTGLTLRFRDNARRPVPPIGPITSGMFQPTNYDGEDPDGTNRIRDIGFKRLNGRHPDGPWGIMFHCDTDYSGVGQLTGGWALELTVEVPR